MTSPTSAFIPAASRAGTPAYSSEKAAGYSAASTTDSRSFEELCPEDDGARADLHREARSSADAARDRAESEAVEKPSATEAEGPHAAEDEAAEDDEDTQPAPIDPQLLLSITPTIMQSLIVASRAAASSPAGAPVGTSAENAAGAQGTPSDATAPQTAAPATTPQAAGAQAGGRAAQGRGEGQLANAAGSKLSTTSGSTTATAPSVTSETASAASLANHAPSTPAEAQGDAPEDTSAHPAQARLVSSKGQAEKTAAGVVTAAAVTATSAENKFLDAGNQRLAEGRTVNGTRDALSPAAMSSSTATSTQRTSQGSSISTVAAMPGATGPASGAETFSVDWKGWTNGGGERASTAAQFSQLGDKLNPVGAVAAPTAHAPAVRATAATPAPAPSAPSVPVDTAEALAPIHSAIERLVIHGRDQLALTVRFEQGGTLSIKLAMNQGEISTHIQTDVPGLEAALKSSWGELTQDWNSRGWKLGQAEFATNTPAFHHRDGSTADGRQSGRQARDDTADTSIFGGRAFSPARLKHAAPVTTLSGVDALRAAAVARRGIHTWA